MGRKLKPLRTCEICRKPFFPEGGLQKVATRERDDMEGNPALIVMARESRGMTQSELADAVEFSQSKLSKYESGILPISEDDVAKLSSVLKYTAEFFQQSAADYFGFGSICVYHRKRASAPVITLKMVQASLNIFRMQVERLSSDTEIEITRRLHQMDVDECGGPVAVARELRRAWQLPIGPIRNLVAILENAGVIVWTTDFGTDRIDALSQVIAGQKPVFFMNSRAPGDRLRFSLCHELGHVIMHAKGSGDAENEADRFAAEFLMPEHDIAPSLRQMSVERAATLKAYWRVSMAALIKRASDLEQISTRHYRTLFTQMSKHGWRLREPVDVEQEKATALASIIDIQMNEHGLSIPKLAARAFLTDPEEFARRFLSTRKEGLRLRTD